MLLQFREIVLDCWKDRQVGVTRLRTWLLISDGNR